MKPNSIGIIFYLIRCLQTYFRLVVRFYKTHKISVKILVFYIILSDLNNYNKIDITKLVFY